MPHIYFVHQPRKEGEGGVDRLELLQKVRFEEAGFGEGVEGKRGCGVEERGMESEAAHVNVPPTSTEVAAPLLNPYGVRIGLLGDDDGSFEAKVTRVAHGEDRVAVLGNPGELYQQLGPQSVVVVGKVDDAIQAVSANEVESSIPLRETSMLGIRWRRLMDVVVWNVGAVQEGEDGGIGQRAVFYEEPFEPRGVGKGKGGLESDLKM